MSRFGRTDPTAFGENAESASHVPCSHGSTISIDDAVAAFRAGDPVSTRDASDREGNDAGGRIRVAVAGRVARQRDLPFLHGALAHSATESHDLGSDERSSFSLAVNHHDTYTGTTDEDRAPHLHHRANCHAPEAIDCSAACRPSGHVHLLRAAPDPLADRQGQTELVVTLAETTELPPTVVVCEMLDDETGCTLAGCRGGIRRSQRCPLCGGRTHQ